MNISSSLNLPKSVIFFSFLLKHLSQLFELNIQPRNKSLYVIMTKIFMNTSAKINVGLQCETGGENRFLVSE